MSKLSWKYQGPVCGILAGLVMILSAGCGTTPIVPFSGTVPQAAIDVDGTYAMTFAPGADTSAFPPNPTLEISGGLLTRFGNRTMTPTDVQVNGDNYIWSSAAEVVFPFVPNPVPSTITLNVNLQPDGTLAGTMTVIVNGQGTNPESITLTKQ
jgi:hypothetical protein